MIRPGDKIGEMTIVSESIFTHKWLVEFCEFDFETIAPTQTTDCTVTNLDTLALGMGLSVAADKLAANWEAKTWELEIDGYPVALEAFGWDDMPYSDTSGAGISRGWSVVLKNLTTGLHTIRWSSSAEITTEDWANVYPPGKYEFIVNLTVAEKAYPTISASPIALEMIKPGDKIGEMTIERDASIHYYRFVDACNFDWTTTKPHSQTVELTLPELSVVGVNIGWVAEKTKIESNWEAISWELYIDDYPIALDQFGWEDISFFDSATEATYRTWNVILRNLSAGNHTVRYSVSQEITIDDGWTTFPPGKFEYIADLTVTEKPIYPTVSSVANPGQHAYTSQKAKLDFLLYLPETYGKDPETKWPLIIYLHDAEWRGTTPEILRGEYNPPYMSGDSLPKDLERGKDLPFIVLSPVGNGGWDFWSKDEMITPLFTVLEEIQSFYSVDAKRIYLTGAGMGGNGVWVMGLRHPEYFAALAPLGGYIYPFEVPENICDLKDVPVRASHGGRDFMVPAKEEQKLVDALNACGGKAQFTVKPDAVIPLDEYANPELYEWFLSQSKK
jgi:hypothetical protein